MGLLNLISTFQDNIIQGEQLNKEAGQFLAVVSHRIGLKEWEIAWKTNLKLSSGLCSLKEAISL